MPSDFNISASLSYQLACADTGSSHIQIRESDATTLSDVRNDFPIRIKLPNGQNITSCKTGHLSLPYLQSPLRVHIFSDEVLDTSLLSISELCNNGCIATISKNNVHVTKDGNTVFNSAKEPSESLWHVNIPACQEALAGSATLRSDTDEAFTKFIDTSFGSPALSTFLSAVCKGFLAAYPRLTPAMVPAYLTLTAATARGHLDQHRQGLDSTASDELDNNETNTDSQLSSRRTAFTKVIPLSHTAHSDLTGRFPIKAASGAEYIFISVLDEYIHCVPMTSRHQTSYISAYKSTLSFWDALGHKPLYQRLDNET